MTDTAYSTRGLTYEQRRELQQVPEWLRPTWTRWARQTNELEASK